ncbi:MAG: peptide chain release factor N(5)-glutamine methyltransferase, partial [Eubacterium sp.]|nr:peptide chain release factor N(5)-glutamine methyltransferase [Eubacterium sp.]
VIILNPNFIKSDEITSLQSEDQYEPSMALDGGSDGLDFYRIINDKWAHKLLTDGMLFLEIGNDQGESILDVLGNFKNIKVLKDMYGNDRMVAAERKEK